MSIRILYNATIHILLHVYTHTATLLYISYNIYVGYNEFTQIPSLDGMKHLTGLDMECNNITSVPWQELATSCR